MATYFYGHGRFENCGFGSSKGPHGHSETRYVTSSGLSEIHECFYIDGWNVSGGGINNQRFAGIAKSYNEAIEFLDSKITY